MYKHISNTDVCFKMWVGSYRDRVILKLQWYNDVTYPFDEPVSMGIMDRFEMSKAEYAVFKSKIRPHKKTSL